MSFLSAMRFSIAGAALPWPIPLKLHNFKPEGLV
jgi:hypothetical protein